MMNQNIVQCIIRLTVLLGLIWPATSRAENLAPVEIKTILVPGTRGKFDYLRIDEQTPRLLANHTGNGTLDVFNLPEGDLREAVPVGAAQDVAIDVEHNRYYVTVSDRRNLTIVNRDTLKVEELVPLPAAPDGCAYDPKNGFVYVGRDDGEELWVVDPQKRSLVTTITVPTAPEFILYDPFSDRIFQNIKSKSVTLVIDPALNSISQTWSTEPAESLHGLASNPETHRLFAAGGNGKLSVIDSIAGKVLKTLEINKGVDQIAFDAGNKKIYCASGKFGLSVLEETNDSAKFLGNIETPLGAHTVAVDLATHSVWIAYAKDDQSFLGKLNLP